MANNDFGNPLKKFKLVFLGEQSGTVSLEYRLPLAWTIGDEVKVVGEN